MDSSGVFGFMSKGVMESVYTYESNYDIVCIGPDSLVLASGLRGR